jgi:hypothetical protein
MRHLLFGTLLTLVCFPIGGCLESTFSLASESRLPKWITLPAGVERAEVTLTVDYYTMLRGDDVQFTLQGKNKQTIKKFSGKERCLKPFQLTNSPGGIPSGYPNYAVVTANGITEIFEQRKPEDILYVTDDPAVWKQYRAIGCD